MNSQNATNTLIDDFLALNIFKRKGNLGTRGRLKSYFKFLFGGVSFNGKNVLDIGSGYGLFTCYMALKGSKKVVALEPEFDGGVNDMIDTAKTLFKKFELQNIELKNELFQDLEFDELFDVILLHNCINHLNEEACVVLKKDTDAQKEFQSYFDKLYKLTKSNGQVLITDSSRSNFFGDLDLKNPIAPTIEYHKHQNAKIWQSFAVKAGFSIERVTYTPLYVLGKIGAILSANRLISYIGLSSFKLVLKKD